jgi:ABC-type antimicrobial peptide transport system permease subunit
MNLEYRGCGIHLTPRELSIRTALGASQARLATQLLTECLLLSFVAALGGLLVAYWATLLAAKVEPHRWECKLIPSSMDES